MLLRTLIARCGVLAASNREARGITGAPLRTARAASGHGLCLRLMCRMIAAFGSGTAFSLVSGMAGPEPLVGAFSTGVVFALLQGGLFQARLRVRSRGVCIFCAQQ